MQTILLLLLGTIIGFIIGRFWVYVTCHVLKLNGKQKIKGYHYHHTLLSIVPIVTLFFVWNQTNLASFLVGTIIGIILEHRIMYGGFYVITRIEDNVK